MKKCPDENLIYQPSLEMFPINVIMTGGLLPSVNFDKPLSNLLMHKNHDQYSQKYCFRYPMSRNILADESKQALLYHAIPILFYFFFIRLGELIGLTVLTPRGWKMGS